MSKKKNIPEIRFKGFAGKWEEKKLGDFGIATSGTSIESEFSDNGKYKVVSIGSYSESSTYTDQGIRAVESEKTHRRILNKDDLTMILNDKTASGNIIGRVLRILESATFVYNQRTQRIEPFKNKYDAVFLYQFLNAPLIRQKIIKSSQGNTQIYVNWSAIKELYYLVPELPEQTKIGSYFQNLDKLISLQQKELDKLKNIKKACLEKMFPKDGSDVPEIRFKGFIEKWEERTLGEIGKTYTGLSGKTKEDFGHGEGKYITYMNIFSNPVSRREITEPIEIDNSQNEVQFGDVFFTTSSETPEEVGMSSVWLENFKNVYLNSFCFGYRPSLKMDSYFLAYMLRSFSFRKKITFLAQGISRYNISKNKVMEITILIPNINEQIKVGKYFQNLDKLISLQQKDLDKLKNIKKACLEKMFV